MNCSGHPRRGDIAQRRSRRDSAAVVGACFAAASALSACAHRRWRRRIDAARPRRRRRLLPFGAQPTQLFAMCHCAVGLDCCPAMGRPVSMGGPACGVRWPRWPRLVHRRRAPPPLRLCPGRLQQRGVHVDGGAATRATGQQAQARGGARHRQAARAHRHARRGRRARMEQRTAARVVRAGTRPHRSLFAHRRRISERAAAQARATPFREPQERAVHSSGGALTAVSPSIVHTRRTATLSAVCARDRIATPVSPRGVDGAFARAAPCVRAW